MSLVKQLSDWIDDRTGYRELTHEALYENIPGGSRWRFVFGSMLVFAFVTQAVTGIFLWMYYSPSSQNAWASVYYIQNEVVGGWLLRGVHHYMAQAMVVLLPLHLVQVILDRAYKAPREFNYWLGLVLMMIVMGLGLTGYLLPWDQKGYWATKVATELMGLPPGGEQIQLQVIGGTEYGHLTLTRFFALHAGVLPALLVFFLVLHILMFRKHGITAHATPGRSDQYFWPHQVFKDAVACFLMLAAVVTITCLQEAELGPPAEPTEPYNAARPEWYFLFLFQLLKKFESEFVGAIVVPSAVMAFLFAMPLVARIRFGHFVNVVVILVLVIGAGYLTYEAVDADNYAEWHPEPPAEESQRELYDARVRAAREFAAAKAATHREYERIQELIAYYGIPKTGPNTLQQQDPETMGPRIFARSCASCHAYYNQEQGEERFPPVAAEGDVKNGAPNLYGFASREWLRKFMTPEGIQSHDYFGNTAHHEGDMVGYVQSELGELDEAQKRLLEDAVLALSAEAKLVYQAEQDQADAERIANGRQVLTGELAIADSNCTDCHRYGETSGDAAPDLTGYGSEAWLAEMISTPESERMYGASGNDRMPAFHMGDSPLLTAEEVGLLAQWLRGDKRELIPHQGKSGAEQPAEGAPAEPPASGEAAGGKGASGEAANGESGESPAPQE